MTLLEIATSTPGWAVTRRTIFSPKKFLTIAKPVSTTLQSKIEHDNIPCGQRVLFKVLKDGYFSFTQLPSIGVMRSVPNLNLILASLGVLLNVDVDGKVSVDVAHLVLEAPGDTDDQVVDKGANGTEGSDTLAGAVVHLDGDDILLGAAKGDGNVGEVLDELA